MHEELVLSFHYHSETFWPPECCNITVYYESSACLLFCFIVLRGCRKQTGKDTNKLGLETDDADGINCSEIYQRICVSKSKGNNG